MPLTRAALFLAAAAVAASACSANAPTAATGSTEAVTTTTIGTTTTAAPETTTTATTLATTTIATTTSTSSAATTTAATAPPTTRVRTTLPPATTTASTAPPVVTTATPPPPPPNVDLSGLGAVAGKVIAIDPGHNGANWQHTAEMNQQIWIGTQYKACDTAGTATDDGYSEAAYNFDVAVRLQAVLAAAGAQVVMSRTNNSGFGPCIDERAYFGNRAQAAVAISIHADGGPASGRGYEANMPANIAGYTDDIYAASHRLGVDVAQAFGAGTGMPPSTYYCCGGLIERSDFGGLNLSDVPKILFETGNMRNATDAALFKDPAFRQREAEALAAGLAAFLAGQ
jgi:N-acetylmuramoyl-L-alanine amidase